MTKKAGLAGLLGAMAMIATLATSRVGADPMTWTGMISDDMCGASHKGMAAKGESDHDCTVSCAKSGSKYVFVNAKDKKVLKIENQKFVGLDTYAGKTVQLTGELKGDAITVSKIVVPPAGK